jgi:hypothetical protein
MVLPLSKIPYCLFFKTSFRRQNSVSVFRRKNKQDFNLDKDKTMDNVQKHNICTNVPSAQTFRSYLHVIVYTLLTILTSLSGFDEIHCAFC